MTNPFMPTPETLATVKDKIFIVSLPRTGTKSLTKMLMILGYTTSHCPSIRLEWEFQANVNQVYADTPVYRPSLFSELAKETSNKFIYIDRDVNEWVDSFERTKLHNAYKDYISRDITAMHRVSKLDRETLQEIFVENSYSTELAKEKFQVHRDMVNTLIPTEQLLIYKFTDGWEPLCQFLEKKIPNEDMPHINKNTLFDKIV